MREQADQNVNPLKWKLINSLSLAAWVVSNFNKHCLCQKIAVTVLSLISTVLGKNLTHQRTKAVKTLRLIQLRIPNSSHFIEMMLTSSFFCSGRMMWSYFSPTLNSFLLLLLCLKPFSAKKDPKGGHLENKNAAGGSDIEAAEGGGCQWWPKSSRLTEILNSPLEVFCYRSNGVNFCVVWRHSRFTIIEA